MPGPSKSWVEKRKRIKGERERERDGERQRRRERERHRENIAINIINIIVLFFLFVIIITENQSLWHSKYSQTGLPGSFSRANPYPKRRCYHIDNEDSYQIVSYSLSFVLFWLI